MSPKKPATKPRSRNSSATSAMTAQMVVKIIMRNSAPMGASRSFLDGAIKKDCYLNIRYLTVMDAFAEDQTFDKFDFTSKPLQKGEYDHCQFLHCDLSSVNLSEIKFIDCLFRDCNLSLAAVSTTVFRDILFTDCKLLGVRW